jgi:4-amino-4-deoxy-L-arabinose transferase-like glycosyltransferase
MKKNWWLFIYLIFFSLIPVIFYWHIVEDDFVDIIATADGLYRLQKLCYAFYQNFGGVSGMTGFSLRPPLPAIGLAASFAIFDHKTAAIFFTFLLPRILVIPMTFLIAKEIMNKFRAYLAATTTGFFLFFQTYALSTLKADSFVVLFTLLGLYFYLIWKRKKQNIYLVLTGLTSAFNLLSKETALPFVLVMFFILIVDLVREKNIRKIIFFIIPCVIFYGSYLLTNFAITKQPSPSFFASKLYISTFFDSFKPYILTVFYYAGINFNYGRLYSLQSAIISLFLFSGIFLLLKSKRYIFILIPFALIFFICFLNSKNIQAGIVGNREVLHRISPVVPFLSIYLFAGADFLAKTISIFIKKVNQRVLTIALSVFIAIIFIYNYFRSPFALDYNSQEFYVTAKAIMTNKKEIAFSSFSKKKNICIVKSYPQKGSMIGDMRKYKVSAFPAKYKEIMISIWIFPLVIMLFQIIKNKKYD